MEVIEVCANLTGAQVLSPLWAEKQRAWKSSLKAMAISGLWFGSLYMSGRSWAKAKYKGNISRTRSVSEHQTELDLTRNQQNQ